MSWQMWTSLGIICGAGALGGFVNALLSPDGFIFPWVEDKPSVGRILKLGFVGNIVLGATAALLSWGLYGPVSNYNFFGESVQTILMTPATIGGAIAVGLGGARWLSNEVDKQLLQAAASTAAAKKGDANSALQIANATPAKALDIAAAMPDRIA